MKNYILITILLASVFALVGCSVKPVTLSECKLDAASPPQDVEKLAIHNQWKTECIAVNGTSLRAGYFPSNINPPKANVLYLEGLADSMFNHDILINSLSKAGYRVIAFDYPGQGGSEGSMNQTRITPKGSGLSWDMTQRCLKQGANEEDNVNDFIGKLDNSFSKYQAPSTANTLLINDMADNVWQSIKSNNENIGSEEQIDAVIGWSTGGLAAYEMAARPKQGIKAVVLIAPVTNTKPVFKIEADKLNSNPDFQHVDIIRPDSPFLVPWFTKNLLDSGCQSQQWKVDDTVQGLILLSDPVVDSFVDIKRVENTFIRNAPDFEIVNYENAAHEIDNETVDNRTDKDNVLLENRVVNFLNSVFR